LNQVHSQVVAGPGYGSRKPASDPALCFEAFLNDNWFGIVLFAGLVLVYQLKGKT